MRPHRPGRPHRDACDPPTADAAAVQWRARVPPGPAMRRPALACLALFAFAFAAPAALAQSPFPDRFTGELGVGVYSRSEVVRSTGSSTLVLPYVYADWGRFFARIDTFGVKTARVGWGHLEVVGRINLEGFDADTAALRGVGDRSLPLPIGLGTMQRTPIGAFFLYALRDIGSGGTLLEATWGARLDLGPVAIYPLLGLEYRSGSYTQQIYGIDAAQSAASGYPTYTPGASTIPMAGLAATVPIAGPWALQLQWRHRWLDSAIADSPIVGTRSYDSGHIAITYAFK